MIDVYLSLSSCLIDIIHTVLKAWATLTDWGSMEWQHRACKNHSVLKCLTHKLNIFSYLHSSTTTVSKNTRHHNAKHCWRNCCQNDTMSQPHSRPTPSLGRGGANTSSPFLCNEHKCSSFSLWTTEWGSSCCSSNFLWPKIRSRWILFSKQLVKSLIVLKTKFTDLHHAAVH